MDDNWNDPSVYILVIAAMFYCHKYLRNHMSDESLNGVVSKSGVECISWCNNLQDLFFTCQDILLFYGQ